MALKQKFALALLLATVLFMLTAGAIFFAFWSDLSNDDRVALSRMLEYRGGLLFVLGLAVVFGFYVTLHFLYRTYILPAVRLAEDIRIIQAANPAHRAEASGGDEMRRLAAAVNS